MTELSNRQWDHLIEIVGQVVRTRHQKLSSTRSTTAQQAFQILYEREQNTPKAREAFSYLVAKALGQLTNAQDRELTLCSQLCGVWVDEDLTLEGGKLLLETLEGERRAAGRIGIPIE